MKHQFHPIARAGVALSLAAAVVAPATAFASYLGFSDLSTSHWAVSSGVVDWSVENKVINGNNGKWMPDAQITRAEAAAVLYNAAGNPEPAKAPAFGDAGALSWAYDAVAWCAQEGIFTGNAATGNFDPWAPLTREQAAKVLMLREGGSEGAASTLDRFSDKDTVSSWARGVVAWAVENGVMNGVDTPSGRLVQGQRACTRAEFVAMLKNVEDPDTDQGGTGGGTGGTDKPTDPDQGGGEKPTDPDKPGQGGDGGATDKPVTPTDPKPGDVDPVTGKVWGVVKPAWTEKVKDKHYLASDGTRFEIDQATECAIYCAKNGLTYKATFKYIITEHPAEYGWI